MENKGFIYRWVNSKIFITIIIMVVIGIGFAYGVNKYLDLKTDIEIYQQNQSALNDSLRVSKNKLNEEVYSKQVLVAKHIKDLKDLNSDLLKEVNKFNGKVHELSVMVAKIKSDTIVIDSTRVLSFPNGDNGIEFKSNEVYDSENSRIVEGMSRFRYDSIINKIIPLGTIITKDEINFNITQGLRTNDDGNVEMFATSRYPGFEVGDLNSVIIDPKSHPALSKFTTEKKLRFGMYGGIGASTNLNDYTVTVGPQVGIGLIYIIW